MLILAVIQVIGGLVALAFILAILYQLSIGARYRARQDRQREIGDNSQPLPRDMSERSGSPPQD